MAETKETKENFLSVLVESFTGLVGIRKDGEQFVFSLADLIQTIISMGLGVLGTFLILKFALKKI